MASGAGGERCLGAPSGAAFLLLCQGLAAKGRGESPGDPEPAALKLGEVVPGEHLPIRRSPQPGACQSGARG